jgi:anaerobic selenocysteine-containing dehydrogenase
MDRRTFIKLTAVSGTSVTLASCGVPEDTLIRFVPEEELAPGIAEWRPSVCPACASGCGVSVRVMPADVEVTKDGQRGVVRMGVAKKLEGIETHPVNQGGLCARGQAAIQLTYHPDRIVQPLKRQGRRGDGQFVTITWDEAVAQLVSELDKLADAGSQHALRAVTGGRGGHRQALFDQFLAKFGAPAAVTFELFGDDVLRRANAMSFGRAQLPTFDLQNARFVLAFGADFLGTWNAPVAQSVGYGRMRRGRPGIRGAFVQVESRMTTTGASADEWLPVRPGTDGALALGIAHVIREHKLRPAASGRAAGLIEGWAGGLAAFAPDAVEKITGVAAARIEQLAHEIAEQSPAVAIVGGPALAHTNGLFTALAVNALNELLGAVGQRGGVWFTPRLAGVETRQAGLRLDALAAGILSGDQAASVLIVDGANPVFAAPRAWNVRAALDKIPFIVSFASFVDETSALADLILPDHSFLESWAEAMPESGSIGAVASVAPPAMKPLFDTRASGDVLLATARALKKPLDLPWQSFEDMLKASFGRLGEGAWAAAQKQGGWWGDVPNPSSVANSSSRPVSFFEATFAGDASQYPYHFLPYPSLQFLDGSLAHLPWLQELPDPMTSAMWSSWVELNPKTAMMLGIKLGDLVEVSSATGTLRSPAFINPAIAPDVVAMPVGQGHTNFTRYASGRGQNPIEILAPIAESETGALAWAATRVKVARVGDPDGKLILFSAAAEQRERPFEGKVR